MIKIGSHVSMTSPNFFLGSVNEAISYNANTFMFYTGAPQNSLRVPLERLKINEAWKMMKDNNIDINNVIVHAPYLINLANLNQEKVAISYNLLVNEINRTIKMGCKYIVLHPGASMDYNRIESLNQVANLLNKAIDSNPSICILLETMAGKGSEIGKVFEEIKYIIDKIDKKDSIGVCLDTCHIHDGGYNLCCVDELIAKFDSIIGLSYLKVCHINDSKNEMGAHKDRHENIGYGKIGFDNLINFIYHPLIQDKIFILETPYIKDDKNSFPPYKFEISSILNKKFDENLYQEVISYYKK
ncbi:MAG: deoxyribonuclease IV [Erysipelotrichaceae bacterium]|nr:deoxyribonuclease IV [Erysipelotrichaceae bacterium]